MPVGQDSRELANVALESDAPADLDEVVAPYAPELRVVTNQVGELGPFLHEVESREPGDTVVEPTDAQQLAQQAARIVEAQRLVEIADQQIGLHARPPAFLPNVPMLPRCFSCGVWSPVMKRDPRPAVQYIFGDR